ncbi:hypothetical protein F5Y06DRAFT_78994 [Hypoxylon sp. FL0890]|nr:hypothetical protein F5Y06DRAFT_78994 [Hypoxylon sp. FL0890]
MIFSSFLFLLLRTWTQVGIAMPRFSWLVVLFQGNEHDPVHFPYRVFSLALRRGPRRQDNNHWLIHAHPSMFERVCLIRRRVTVELA